MTPVAVKPLDDASEAAWDAFVDRCDEATFFHYAGWRRVIGRTLRHATQYRAAWRDDRLVGILPLVHVVSPLFGKALISTGFGVYGGIAAEDNEAAQALAADAASLGKKLGVDFIELRQMTANPIGWTAKSDLYVTFCRALDPSPDVNLKAVPRKKRADLRKAIADTRLTVETGIPVSLFFRLYSESLRNLGTPVLPQRFYAAIAEEFGDAVELSAVSGPDGPVAALMTFDFKDRVMPYYGGATHAARGLHAYDLLYWSLMNRAVERGRRVFDFGRSKRGTGSFDYKTYWGFEPTPLHYQFHLPRGGELPEINPLNPKYRLMVTVWQRLPLAVANRLGPLVARQIG
jgi:FemAB-related protein (PEP-CTERM system-associated)